MLGVPELPFAIGMAGLMLIAAYPILIGTQVLKQTWCLCQSALGFQPTPAVSSAFFRQQHVQ